jgi:MFS family permease
MKLFKEMKIEMKIYLLVLAFVALGSSMSGNVLSNYFKDVYNTNAFQRGFIEFPRELPGMLSIFMVALLAKFSDVKIAIISMILAAAGILVLGYLTPTFYIMLIFIFINSVGSHLFMPMQQTIGMGLVDDGRLGKRMGQFSGVTTAFSMFGSILVFLGFKYGFFSFQTPTKWIFIISAVTFLVAAILLYYLNGATKGKDFHHKKEKFVYRKEYSFYYTLVIMFGVQKQIMMVYAPWVMIDLLGKPVETLAILSILGSFVGIFFIPALGRWLDKFGVKKLLYADALSFIIVYALFGLLSGAYASGTLAKVGFPVFLGYALFIIDRMSTQMGIVRTIYLKKIAIDSKDITPTLSLGLTLDHFVSIVAAFIGGIVWMKFGPSYIFYMVSFLSFVNLYVAIKVKVE